MKKVFLFCLISILAAQTSFAKVDREFRATWVTTVWGIDWPKTQINPKAVEGARIAAMKKQKAELCEIFDSLETAGMNAAFFQVRGMSDAMYKSSYENWCQYLTGERGADPGYDPLQFAIEEAHKRGLELHAWLNPYRYSSSEYTFSELENDYAVQHPDWIMKYDRDGISILNPGLPEVRQRIKEIIGEIVTKYDVDGIVFDDYFYAYGGTNSTLDKDAQDKYKPKDQNLGDWRRENVNKMVKDVYDTIHAIKPYVKFGISPFGTWTTDKSVADKEGIMLPSGVSNTGDMYKSIYCDPIAWLKAGTIDYISPQIYWTSDSPYPFGKLSDWWSQIANRFGRHFYASHTMSGLQGTKAPQQRGLSHIENASYAEMQQRVNGEKPQQRAFSQYEIGKQVNFNRTYDLNDAPGSVFYNTTGAIKTKGFVNYLRNSLYANFAITPYINWKSNKNIETPNNFVKKGNAISWENSDKTYRTVIFAIPNNYNGTDKFDSKHAIKVVYEETFNIPTKYANGYTFAIMAFDRLGNISAPIVLGQTAIAPKAPSLTYPANNASALLPCVFKWKDEEGLNGWTEFQWQLASDEKFNNIIATRNVTTSEFNSSVQNNIKSGEVYYWRVRTLKENGTSNWSKAFKLTAKIFGVNAPFNGETNVSITPKISWDKVEGNTKYKLTIATDNTFLSKDIVFEKELTTNEITIPEGTLTQGTTYFVKVAVQSGNVSAVSQTITFYTKEIEVPIPTITSPKNGDVINENKVKITWKEQPANGFRVELSSSESFPPRGMKIKKADAYTYEVEYTDMKAGTYYVRVKAETKFGYTEPSLVVKFTIENTTDVENVSTNDALIVKQDDNTINLYPNTSINNIKKISIISINGIEVMSKDNVICENDEYISLNISSLIRGTYIIKIETNRDRKILKFQK